MEPRHCSLLQHGRDPSGQYYRRNRFYDASTGRFTQEDPIGLAGGLNLYGFANGDPVSYGDPYGLRPDTVIPGTPMAQIFVSAMYGWSETFRKIYDALDRSDARILFLTPRNKAEEQCCRSQTTYNEQTRRGIIFVNPLDVL